MLDEYLKARRLGLKAYNAKLQARVSPNLMTLDEVLPEKDALTHVSLGVQQIPLERVVGTSTKARAYAFAPNFMPIIEPRSEFSDKWIRLYDAMIEDGMRQPLKVYEYLNDYYVIEGNKRVSVMKYLEAVLIEAEVIRIMPNRRQKDERTRIYFEYLPFNSDSGINDIFLTQTGAYEKLIALTGHTPGEKWTNEDRAELRGIFWYFKNEYRQIYADRPPMPEGDAFLIYLTVFGYRETAEKSGAEMNADLKKLKTEIERSASDDAVNLILNPPEPPQAGLLSALFRPAKVKAAFIYHRPIHQSGWNYWHDLGRINCENKLGDKLETTVSVISDPKECEGEIERLIKEGNKVIFATSPLMLEGAMRPSIQHPEVKILCCSLLASYHHVRSYYLRTYEAKFLIGMIAGAMTENDQIGYVADYPIYGIPASINAFAMGARMVNPRAKVHVAWSTCLDFDPADPFPGKGIRVISNRDINAPAHSTLEYGLYKVTENGIQNLAIPLLDWSRFYETIIESVLAGSFEGDSSGVSALDYWWGMSSNAIDYVLSSKFDPYLTRLINTYASLITAGQFWPFEGEIRDQNGDIVCEAPYRLTPAEILVMDYLQDNVIGSIPKIEALKESAHAIVRLQGLGHGVKPDETKISWNHLR